LSPSGLDCLQVAHCFVIPIFRTPRAQAYAHSINYFTTNHFLLVNGFYGQDSTRIGQSRSSGVHVGVTCGRLRLQAMRAYRETYQRCKPVKLGITLAFPVRSNKQTIRNSSPPAHRSAITTPRFGLAPSLPLHQSVSSSGVPCLWLTNSFLRNHLVWYFIAA